MAHLTAHAPDISCDGCASAIQRALGKLDGVRSVQVNVPTKDVEVEFDEAALTPEQILEKLSRAGYDGTLKPNL